MSYYKIYSHQKKNYTVSRRFSESRVFYLALMHLALYYASTRRRSTRTLFEILLQSLSFFILMTPYSQIFRNFALAIFRYKKEFLPCCDIKMHFLGLLYPSTLQLLTKAI